MDKEEAKKTWKLLPEIIETFEAGTTEAELNSDVENLPTLKYQDIIEELKRLREETKDGKLPKPNELEQVMIDWLKEVAPDKVNDRNLKAIHFFACGIADKLSEKKPKDSPQHLKK